MSCLAKELPILAEHWCTIMFFPFYFPCTCWLVLLDFLDNNNNNNSEQVQQRIAASVQALQMSWLHRFVARIDRFTQWMEYIEKHLLLCLSIYTIIFVILIADWNYIYINTYMHTYTRRCAVLSFGPTYLITTLTYSRHRQERVTLLRHASASSST